MNQAVNAHRERSAADTVSIPVAEALVLGRKVLARVGYGPEDADRIVLHMIDGVWSGYPHTGLSRILAILDEPRTHQPRTAPKIVRETATSASIDAGNTVGYVAALQAADSVIAKARSSGVAAVTFFNTYFSGRNSYYLERIARAGLVGIHAVSTPPWVAPYGGRTPALGVNPIGFGFPCDPEPIVCDLGTASFMWGEIILHKRMGKPLPEGVAIDSSGEPTTDPEAALGGAILPFGGHKGSALNLAVQLLCALAFPDSPERPQDDFGFIFVAIDPGLFGPADAYRRNVEKITAWVAATPPRAGYEVRLPSARSSRLRLENQARGMVPCEIRVYRHLQELAQEAAAGRPTA